MSMKFLDCKKICILVSFKKEIELFLGLLENVRREKKDNIILYRGSFENRELCILQTGMGKNPPIESFLEGSHLLISTGICGGLIPSLRTGDIVVSEKVLFMSKETVDVGKASKCSTVIDIPESSATYRLLREKLKGETISVNIGPTITSKKLILNSRKKRMIHSNTAAIAIEMEDYYRLGSTKKLSIPAISVRAVFDRLNDSFPLSLNILNPGIFKKLQRAKENIAIALKALIY